MFYDKLLYLFIHTHTQTHTHIHTYIHTYIYIYIYLLINIKNNGKPETVHRYWLVSEIYRTAGQTGTSSGTVLTPLIWRMNNDFYLLATNFFLYTLTDSLSPSQSHLNIISSFIIYSFFNNYTSSNIFLFNT